MTEKWAWVPGFEGSYKISDRGRVRSVHRVIERRDGTNQTINGRIMRPARHRNGRCSVLLAHRGEYTRIWPDQLVRRLFNDEEKAA